MLNKDQIKDSLSSFRQRIKESEEFRKRIKAKVLEDDAQRSFFNLCTNSLIETVINIFPTDNYDAGKRIYEEDDIHITHFEMRVILLVEPDDSPLRQYAKSVLKFDRSGLTRSAILFGLPTERREINDQQSLFNIAKNFIGYKDDGSFARNFFLSFPFIIYHLTIVSIKVFISFFKLFTEFGPYLLSEFFDESADKALASIKPQSSNLVKGLLYSTYYGCKTCSILTHVAYFVGRTLTSPAKGVMSAAREGGRIGDRISGERMSILGNVLSTLFAVISLTMTVFAYLVLIPIKLTISFTTTVPFLANHLPAFIVKPIAYLVTKISPTLTHIGDFLGKFLDPIVDPVARALNENLTFSQVGLGGFAGIASAAAETSYTLFGSKLLRALAVGIVGFIVTGCSMVASFIRANAHAHELEKTHATNATPAIKMTTLRVFEVVGTKKEGEEKKEDVKKELLKISAHRKAPPTDLFKLEKEVEMRDMTKVEVPARVLVSA